VLLALLAASFACNCAGQTVVTNGAETPGTLAANATNSYTFNATNGDSIVLRVGAPVMNPRLVLLNPASAVIGLAGSGVSGAHEAYLPVSATNTGTFTVQVSSIFAGGSGSYVLRLAKIPGDFVVSPGDEGGALANGTLNSGTNSLGDLDMWSFYATNGDTILLRMGAPVFNPRIDLYGPCGKLLATDGSGAAAAHDSSISVQATNSGTFTVLTSSFNNSGTGNYLLNLAKIPGLYAISIGDEGGPLVNGLLNSASNSLGDLDMWTFNANSGDSIVLRMGGNPFNPWIRLYNPSGVLVGSGGNGASGYVDVDVAVQATNTGTYTVVTSSFIGDGTGNYFLTLAKAPGAISVSPGDEGGPLTNGWQHTGSLIGGDLDVWSFSANAGNSVVLRMGATNYNPWIRLYNPNGTLVGAAGNGVSGNHDVEVAIQATNTGAFTVVVASYLANGSGSYLLNMAQSPGAVFTSPGDEGGVMTNGWKYTGILNLGDLDVWNFAANSGDTLVLRMATTNFNPGIRLYGPSGALVGVVGTGVSGNTDASLSVQVTNTGTFTVVASSFIGGGTGNYLINLAHMPAAFTVAPGDEGGTLVGGISQNGTIDLGDMDLWKFIACRAETITITCQKLSGAAFTPRIRLYGRTGALTATALNPSLATIHFTATNSGVYTVLVDGANVNDSGTYQLTGNGLTDALNLCLPIVIGTNLSLGGIGGTANEPFILYTTTNVAAPLGAWLPILTNQFDGFGIFDYTNAFNRNEPARFFRLLEQ
jgi:hypothetical protein